MKKKWLGEKQGKKYGQGPNRKKKIFKGQIKKNKMMKKTKLVRGKIEKKVGGHGYCSLTFIKNMVRDKMKKKNDGKKIGREKIGKQIWLGAKSKKIK